MIRPGEPWPFDRTRPGEDAGNTRREEGPEAIAPVARRVEEAMRDRGRLPARWLDLPEKTRKILTHYIAGRTGAHAAYPALAGVADQDRDEVSAAADAGAAVALDRLLARYDVDMIRRVDREAADAETRRRISDHEAAIARERDEAMISRGRARGARIAEREAAHTAGNSACGAWSRPDSIGSAFAYLDTYSTPAHDHIDVYADDEFVVRCFGGSIMTQTIADVSEYPVTYHPRLIYILRGAGRLP